MAGAVAAGVVGGADRAPACLPPPVRASAMTPAIRPMAAGTASQRLAGKREPLLGPWLITSNRHPYHRTDSGAYVQFSRGSRSQAKEAAPILLWSFRGGGPLPGQSRQRGRPG